MKKLIERLRASCGIGWFQPYLESTLLKIEAADKLDFILENLLKIEKSNSISEIHELTKLMLQENVTEA